MSFHPEDAFTMHFIGAKQFHSQIRLLFLKKVEVEIELTSVNDLSCSKCPYFLSALSSFYSTLHRYHRLDFATGPMTKLFDTDDECS